MPTTLDHQGSNDSTRKELRVDNVEQREEYAATKPTFGQKAKRHCARFWWLHLIIFCIIFLVVALLVVYVGMPRIAQHQVDDATLEIRDTLFGQPTSNSVVLLENATLHNPSTFTPSFDAFDAAFFLVTNGTYGPAPAFYLPMPKIHAQKPAVNATIENKLIEFTNIDQVAAYAIAVIQNEYVETALVGKTKLHLGTLPTQHITFNTTSKYKGLNGLKGFNTTDLRIDLSAPAGQPNLRGIAHVPNPSLLTILMGNITLILSTEAKGVVGVATIQDFTLVPGPNQFNMTAVTNQTLILQSLTEGRVNMSITGNSSVYNGQHLTYYERALSSNKLVLDMNVNQILQDSLHG